MTAAHFNKMDSKKETADIIAAFLNKHGNDRNFIIIDDDYQFEVNSIYDIEIPVESINTLPSGTIQFNGTARVKQQDAASKIVTDVKVSFHGNAFFAEDIQGDDNLLEVSIDQMKQC